MRSEDRVFLNDFTQFGFMNHIVAARAFYKAGARASETASEMRADAENLEIAQASQSAASLNDAPRVQRIAVARLYGELVACIEDAGALHGAVRHRAKDGLFKWYLDSQAPDVANFLDYVRTKAHDPLDQLLNLPALSTIQGNVPPDLYAQIQDLYTTGSKDLAEMADMYRRVIPASATAATASLPADWPDRVNIVLSLETPGQASNPPRGGLLAQTYNKIKHRFSVIEDMDGFVHTATHTREIRYASHSLQPDPVHLLFTNVLHVSLASANLTALLLILDQHGIAV